MRQTSACSATLATSAIRTTRSDAPGSSGRLLLISRWAVLSVVCRAPKGLGLVESLPRPGGNVTGVANLRADLTAKRLDLFKEAVPALRRVLVTYDPRRVEEREAVATARTAARRLGLTLIEHPIASPLEIEPALAALEEGGRDGILIVQAGTHLNVPGRSLEVATSRSLPTMYPAAFWATVGALVAYGPDQYAQGKQAARLAHKVLTGTPPAQIPVELPDVIEFVVNLKTARRLGLQVPPSALLRAERLAISSLVGRRPAAQGLACARLNAARSMTSRRVPPPTPPPAPP